MSVFLCFVIIQQVGREQGGDRITCITVKLEVATNNLNGCWLARGCLLQRVQLGEPKRRAGQKTCFFFLFLNFELESITVVPSRWSW